MTSTPAGGTRTSYLPSIDGIRAFAVSSAILFHLSFLADLPTAPGFLRHVLPAAMGLEMFFVLSGTLITGMLVREFGRSNTISVSMFYVRRSRRLAPGLLLVLPGLLIAQAVLGSGPTAPLGPSALLTVGALLASVGNWRLVANLNGLGWLGPLWTLGIEEQFYVTWPLALRAALRRKISRGVILAVLGLLLAACVVVTAVVQSHVRWRYTYYFTTTQLTGLVMGCALGYELAANTRGRLARALSSQLVAVAGVAGMVGVAGWVAHSPADLARYGYLGFGIGACLLVGHCFVVGHNRSVVTAVLSWRPIAGFGKWSYEIYLIHMGVILAVLRAAPTMPVPAMIALDLAIMIALAAPLYHFAERPVREHGWKRALARLPRPTRPSRSHRDVDGELATLGGLEVQHRDPTGAAQVVLGGPDLIEVGTRRAQ